MAFQSETWSPWFDSIRVGQGDSYTEIQRDGSMQMFDGATTWDDLRFPVQGQRLDTSAGRTDFDYVENVVNFQDNARYPEEPLCIIAQMQHEKALGTAIHPHIHWIQNQDADPNWLMEYRYYNNGDAVPVVALAIPQTLRSFDYTSGSILQLTVFPAISAPAGETVSAICDIRIFRDTANASTLFTDADAYTGDASLKEFDIHYQVDSTGSREEFSK